MTWCAPRCTRLHARLGFTAVFVTHDQSEALALADRLAVMRDGRLEQVGAPDEVFERPASEYVADFVGMSNRLDLRRSGDAWTCEGIALEGAPPQWAGSGPCVVRLPPEALQVVPVAEAVNVSASVSASASSLRARIVDVSYGGRHVDVVATVGETRLHARVPATPEHHWARQLPVGHEVAVRFDSAAARIFDPGDAATAARATATPVLVSGRAGG